MKMLSFKLSLLLILIFTIQCNYLGVQEVSLQNCESLLGDWKIINTDGQNEYKNYVVRLARNKNGEMSSLIIDLRPSSGVYVNRLKATLKDSIIHCEYPDWGGVNRAFKGKVSDNYSKITEISDNKYKKIWIKDSSNETKSFIDRYVLTLKTDRKRIYTYQKPEKTGDGWICSDLTSEGLNKDRISSLIQRTLDGKYDDIHDLVIVKNGKLVLEEYFRANGKIYGPQIIQIYRDKRHLLASSTKVATSILTGIAIKEGFIKNIDMPVFDFFPDYADLKSEQKDKILLKHLLTMTAGLKWDDPEDAYGMWDCDDVIRYYLERPVVAEPGSEFKYSNANSTTLGEIIKRGSGLSADKFADMYLFTPLGISNVDWSRYPDGTIDTDGSLALRPRDFAKIGQLFLNKGKWGDHQIISTEWILESTKKQIKRTNDRWYGYKWWQTDFNIQGRKVESFHSWGWGGQYLFVFPDLDLIVVSHAGNFDYKPERYLFKIIKEYILPSTI